MNYYGISVTFMIQACNVTQSWGIPLEQIIDIGAFLIRPGAKMAAILQNGADKLPILPKNSALSYVLGAKHNEVSICTNYYGHAMYLHRKKCIYDGLWGTKLIVYYSNRHDGDRIFSISALFICDGYLVCPSSQDLLILRAVVMVEGQWVLTYWCPMY